MKIFALMYYFKTLGDGYMYPSIIKHPLPQWCIWEGTSRDCMIQLWNTHWIIHRIRKFIYANFLYFKERWIFEIVAHTIISRNSLLVVQFSDWNKCVSPGNWTCTTATDVCYNKKTFVFSFTNLNVMY